MNADGSGATRLTNNYALDSCPIWSPDGRRIAFRSERDGNGEIYVMNADGSGVTRLTHLTNGPTSFVPKLVSTCANVCVYQDSDGDSHTHRHADTYAHQHADPTPTSTPTPTPTNTPTPTPVPEEPRVDLHASATNIMTGRPVGLALAVTNPRTNPVLNVSRRRSSAFRAVAERRQVYFPRPLLGNVSVGRGGRARC